MTSVRPSLTFCTFVITCVLSTALFSQSGSELKESLFGETDKLMVQVQAEQGNVLSPSNYKKALNKYTQAVNEFTDGKRIRDIEKKLGEVRSLLSQCLKITGPGKTTFATALRAREDALKTNAPEYAKELYDRAESEFLTATRKLERNDVKGAKNKIQTINSLYRQAELSAIKVSVIGNVRNLMHQAKDEEVDKYTPITYATALRLLNESESILNSNRRSESSAKEKAEQAEIETKHAIFLTRQIKRLRKNQGEWENFILDREIFIEDIAQELGFAAHFDEGMDRPLKGILKIAKILQREKRNLTEEVQQKNIELEQLNETLKKYREKEAGLQAELQEKQYRLEVKRKREELIRSVENMFESQVAVVLRKGDDFIIRLIGLTFPSGNATIKPEFFSLLATVQRALRKFPNAPFTIEGHTDAVGDDRYNENLSFERAHAIKQYLLANMGLEDSRITALGYGETRPIASNESAQGRAQNRRIDIVITSPQETL